MQKALGHDAECPQRSTSIGPYPNEKKKQHPCHLQERVKSLTQDLSPCLIVFHLSRVVPLSHSNILLSLSPQPLHEKDPSITLPFTHNFLS